MRCDECETVTYRNPLPVANLLIPHEGGLIVQRRGIDPGKGLWALPGGFIMRGESWQEAAAREAKEEVNVDVMDPPRTIEHHWTCSIPGGTQLLVFGILRSPQLYSVGHFTPTTECEDRSIVSRENWRIMRGQFAFMRHIEAVEMHFESRAQA